MALVSLVDTLVGVVLRHMVNMIGTLALQTMEMVAILTLKIPCLVRSEVLSALQVLVALPRAGRTLANWVLSLTLPYTTRELTVGDIDLIRDNTPHLGPRIQLMLSQLQFKLDVEEKYKDGIEKIMGSYAMEGDKKTRQEAQSNRVESMQKIQLLSRALKRYRDINVDIDSASDVADGKVELCLIHTILLTDIKTTALTCPI